LLTGQLLRLGAVGVPSRVGAQPSAGSRRPETRPRVSDFRRFLVVHVLKL
jgi:hypothetical protein